MPNIHTCDDPRVEKCFTELNNHRLTKWFVKSNEHTPTHIIVNFCNILEKGEKLKKVGQKLYIININNNRKPAADVMKMKMNITHTIRWINELYFSQGTSKYPISFKNHIISVYPDSKWFS